MAGALARWASSILAICGPAQDTRGVGDPDGDDDDFLDERKAAAGALSASHASAGLHPNQHQRGPGSLAPGAIERPEIPKRQVELIRSRAERVLPRLRLRPPMPLDLELEELPVQLLGAGGGPQLYLRVRGTQGEGGTLRELGLRPDDYLFRVAGTPCRSLADLRYTWARLRSGDWIAVEYARLQGSAWLLRKAMVVVAPAPRNPADPRERAALTACVRRIRLARQLGLRLAEPTCGRLVDVPRLLDGIREQARAGADDFSGPRDAAGSWSGAEGNAPELREPPAAGLWAVLSDLLFTQLASWLPSFLALAAGLGLMAGLAKMFVHINLETMRRASHGERAHYSAGLLFAAACWSLVLGWTVYARAHNRSLRMLLGREAELALKALRQADERRLAAEHEQRAAARAARRKRGNTLSSAAGDPLADLGATRKPGSTADAPPAEDYVGHFKAVARSWGLRDFHLRCTPDARVDRVDPEDSEDELEPLDLLVDPAAGQPPSVAARVEGDSAVLLRLLRHNRCRGVSTRGVVGTLLVSLIPAFVLWPLLAEDGLWLALYLATAGLFLGCFGSFLRSYRFTDASLGGMGRWYRSFFLAFRMLLALLFIYGLAGCWAALLTHQIRGTGNALSLVLVALVLPGVCAGIRLFGWRDPGLLSVAEPAQSLAPSEAPSGSAQGSSAAPPAEASLPSWTVRPGEPLCVVVYPEASAGGANAVTKAPRAPLGSPGLSPMLRARYYTQWIGLASLQYTSLYLCFHRSPDFLGAAATLLAFRLLAGFGILIAAHSASPAAGVLPSGGDRRPADATRRAELPLIQRLRVFQHPKQALSETLLIEIVVSFCGHMIGLIALILLRPLLDHPEPPSVGASFSFWGSALAVESVGNLALAVYFGLLRGWGSTKFSFVGSVGLDPSAGVLHAIIAMQVVLVFMLPVSWFKDHQ